MAGLCVQVGAVRADETHAPAAHAAASAAEKSSTIDPPAAPVDDGTPRLGVIQGIALPFKPVAPSSRPRQTPAMDSLKTEATPRERDKSAPVANVDSKPGPTQTPTSRLMPASAPTPTPAQAAAAAPATAAPPAVIPAASTLRPIFAAGRHRSSMRPGVAAPPTVDAAIAAQDETRSAPARHGSAAASSLAAPPAPAISAGDQPLEHLRQRLAQTFGSRDMGGATVRVSSKGGLAEPGAASSAAGTTRQALARLPNGRPVERRAAAGSVPAAAAATAAASGTCGSGQRQSPIDLRDTFKVDLEPVAFRYQPSAFTVIDDGRTVLAQVAPGNSIEVGGRSYELTRVEFRHPAEERIDGRTFSLGVHLVHRDSEGRQAVVAVVMDEGESGPVSNPVVQTVWNNLPLERGQAEPARAPLDLERLLPSSRGYFTYMGSMTAPPCEEGVLWMVMKTPMPIATPQVDLFARLYPMNARALQAANGRMVKESN